MYQVKKKENVHGEVIRCEPGARNMGAQHPKSKPLAIVVSLPFKNLESEQFVHIYYYITGLSQPHLFLGFLPHLLSWTFYFHNGPVQKPKSIKSSLSQSAQAGTFHKVPETGRVTNNRHFFLTAVEAGRPRSSCSSVGPLRP